MFTRLGKQLTNYNKLCNSRLTYTNIYNNNRLFSNISTNNNEPINTNEPNTTTSSTFDKLYTYAKPVQVKGIWRAPRELVFTKQQFEKAYPNGYHGMRIGLPPADSWMAKYIEPKLDAISPILWTLLFISPILYYSIVHSLWEIGILPSNTHSH